MNTTRRLGEGGPEVGAIGFGSWAIGGPHTRDGAPIGWGEVDDDESVAAVHAALDAGVTFFDTADVYGTGHSERVLARALGDRDDVVIATKFGHTYDEERRESPGRDARPEYIRWACDRSLERLGRERIDLYLFHLNDYPIEDAAEVLGTLEELVDAGKIASFGWSTDDPERAALFGRSPHGAAVEHRLNLFEGDHRMLEVCEELGMASLNRTPLGMGLLSGTWDRGTRFAADDIRSTWDLDAEPGRRMDAVEALREILTADGATVAQGALRWLLSVSPRTIPLPGIRTVAQATENAGAMRLAPFDDATLARIEELAAPLRG